MTWNIKWKNKWKTFFRSFPEIQTGLISGSGTWPAQSSVSSLDPFSYLGTRTNPGTHLGTFGSIALTSNPRSCPSNPSVSPSNCLVDSRNSMLSATNPFSRLDHSGMHNPGSGQAGLHDDQIQGSNPLKLSAVPEAYPRLEVDHLRRNHSTSGKSFCRSSKILYIYVSFQTLN